MIDFGDKLRVHYANLHNCVFGGRLERTRIEQLVIVVFSWCNHPCLLSIPLCYGQRFTKQSNTDAISRNSTPLGLSCSCSASQGEGARCGRLLNALRTINIAHRSLASWYLEICTTEYRWRYSLCGRQRPSLCTISLTPQYSWPALSWYQQTLGRHASKQGTCLEQILVSFMPSACLILAPSTSDQIYGKTASGCMYACRAEANVCCRVSVPSI